MTMIFCQFRIDSSRLLKLRFGHTIDPITSKVISSWVRHQREFRTHLLRNNDVDLMPVVAVILGNSNVDLMPVVAVVLRNNDVLRGNQIVVGVVLGRAF
jgi:hypothetical protein